MVTSSTASSGAGQRVPHTPRQRIRARIRISQSRGCHRTEWRSGSAQRVHAFRIDDRAALRQPPGPISGGHHFLQSGAGRFAGRSHQGDRQSAKGNRHAAEYSGRFQGTAASFQASLANEPLLILAALVTVYIVLGVLYESYIHPITILVHAAFGRRGRDSGPADLRAGIERRRADRNHSADRHREERTAS